MGDLFQDIKYAVRGLLRSPGFTATAVLTLALGIGANTAIFSVVHAVLLRPPQHVADFDRLAAIYTSDFSGPPFGASSYADIQDFARAAPALSGIAAYTGRPLVLSDSEGGRPAEVAQGQIVTGNYFDVLGVPMAAGRAFTGDEVRAGGANVVVLGEAFWRTRYGADPTIVGGTIRLAGTPFTVLGIAPAGFKGLFPPFGSAFYVSMEGSGAIGGPDPEVRGSRGLFVTGRLADGATVEQARSQLSAVAGELHRQYPESWTDVRNESRRVTVIPATEAIMPPQVRGTAVTFAAVLMAVVAAVLLICCANIANLLLVRATGRQREIGIRLALGAGQARVIRQLVTESMVLAGFGAVSGVALAYGGTRLIAGFDLPLPLGIELDVAPDLTVLGFALLVTLVAGLLFGLAPALHGLRTSLTSSIREDRAAAGLAGRRLGLRGLLAGGQITVAVVLLVMAGLLVRSLRSAQSMDPGFRTADMLFVNLAQDERTTPPEQRVALHRELRERVSGLPGVRAVSYVSALPLGGGRGRRGFRIEGYTPGESEEMEFNFTDGGPGYLEAMGIPLSGGRDFAESDGAGAPRVAIVNEAFARRYLPGADPIGKRLNPGRPTEAEIIGVARDGKYRSLAEEPLPFVYLALDQNSSGFVTLVVQAPGGSGRLGDAVRQLVTEVAPDVAITSVVTADQHLSFALLPQRAGAWLLGLFGLLGLALASLGVYGVMAFAVSRRAREIGIRLAIGAKPSDIVGMVVRQGATVTAIGAVLGLAIAAGLSRFLRFLLFGVEPLDPIAFGASAAIVAVVTLLANWIPARRSAGASAVSAMRGD